MKGKPLKCRGEKQVTQVIQKDGAGFELWCLLVSQDINTHGVLQQTLDTGRRGSMLT